MKNLKTKLSISVGVLVLVSMLVAVGLVKADVGSLYDKIANVAGNILGNYLIQQSDNSGQLGQAYDESYTNFTKLNVTDTFNTSLSFDPFIVGNTNLTIATGTSKFVWTATVDTLCSGSLASMLASSTDAYKLAPAIVFSMGTSTSATGYATNLIASTTTASTSPVSIVALTYTKNFFLRAGESITGAISDYMPTASSTDYSRIILRPSIPCWEMGQ